MRSYTPGFNRGIIDPVWFAKHDFEEQILGARDALNVTLEADGSLQKRPGSEFFAYAPAPGSGQQQGALIPYFTDSTNYMIYLRVDGSLASNRTIHVYQNTGGAWSTTPVDWRSTDTTVGKSDFSPYLDNSNLASTTLEAHPYSTNEAAELRYTQFDDKLFIFHPNHPTILIQKGPSNVWTFDPYVHEHSPPEVGSVRRGLTWNIELDSGDVYDITTNQNLFSMEESPRQQDASGGVGPGPVVFHTPATLYPGSFFRFGDQNMTYSATGEEAMNFGTFWTVLEVVDSRTAKITPVNGQTGAGAGNFTINASAPYELTTTEHWAGPWNRTEETVTGFTLSAAIPTQQAVSITGTGGGITEDMVGCLLLSVTLNTVFLVMEANSGAATARLANVGQDAGAAGTGTLTVYRPNAPICMINGRFDTCDITIIGDDQLPDAHETSFVDARWLIDGPGEDTTNTDGVGGSVMYGGQGIARCDVKTVVNNAPGRRVVRYSGFHQKKPSHFGPFTEYGWGPSKGAGFAAFGTTFQRRLMISGYGKQSSTVVGSLTNRPEILNALEYTGYADGPLNLQLGFKEGDKPQWLLGGDFLMIGCERNEYVLDGNPISTTSLGFEKVGSYGSSSVEPVQVGPRILWVSASGKQVWEGVFEERHNAVVARSLLWQSEEALLPDNDKITKLASIQHDVAHVYALSTSGDILVLTHSEDTGVKGWTRWRPAQALDGGTVVDSDNFLDIVVVPSGSTAKSPYGLAVVVDRQHTGPLDLLSIEFLFRYNKLSDAPQGDWYGLGASLTATTADLPGGVGLSRYWFMIVDGVYGGKDDDSSTAVDFSSLGLSGAPAQVKLMMPINVEVDLFIPPMPSNSGISSGQMQSVRSVSLFLDKSVGGTANGRNIEPVIVGASPSNFLGWKFVPGALTGVNARFPTLEIRHELPYNFRLGAAAFDGGSED